MTNFRNLGFLLTVFALLGLSSCSEDDDANTVSPSILGSTSVYDVVRNNGSLTSLEAALDVAAGDLPTTLNGEGPFTLFAPDNGAFDDLAAKTGFVTADSLLASIDPALLSTILSYHVVASENGAEDITDGSSLTTTTGAELTFTVTFDEDLGMNVIRISDATKQPQTPPSSMVGVSNPDPSNGTVHIIDRVLLPQEAIDAFDIDTRPSILNFATATDNLSSLASAVTKANLAETLAGLDSTTVLAPTNEAFEALFETLGDDYEDLDDFDNDAEIAVLADILRYHVLSGTTDLMAGQVETALEGESVEVSAQNGGFAFGDATSTNANVVTADVEANNGFVQIVDRVLVPQAALDFLALLGSDDLATTVVNTPQLSILLEALIATDLADDFADATNTVSDSTATNFTYFMPATVFAPTDAAFADLFEVLGDDYTGIESFDTEDELELLEEILLYHVVAGRIESGDLTAGSVTTVAESDIEIIPVLGTENFVIGDASNNTNTNILIADVNARNGVAHVVDKVLLPQNAVDFIVSVNEEDEE